ncbi:venom serine protease Bi-VSP-like [Colias croceus]|uniref:venom serine protease Bi-VSP-like n=1 Tax=Colias crocea TaxID=72248 RepID=UPI001E27D463|nr:venom serine protease Bi-VSP-like [Colias croceus]
MLKYLILLLCACVRAQYYYRRGQVCDVDNSIGTCKSVNQCPYAQQLIYQNEINAPSCFYEQNVLIACCPNNFVMHRTGTFRDLFLSSVEGIKRSNDMICRYDGREPIVCCRNSPSPPVRDEPRGCPPLPRVYLRGKQDSHVAWRKCLENQRYTDKCVSAKDDPDEYERVSTCPDAGDGYRIIAGTDAVAREFPHMASLGCHSMTENDTKDIIWIGAGSLISDKFILTAAHVLQEPTHKLIKYALLGTTKKTDVRDGILYNIIKWYPHNLYSLANQTNDIGLVELDRRVVFSEFIRPACLPLPDIELDTQRIVAGWGQTAQAGNTSDTLLKTQIEIVPNIMCINQIKKKHFKWNEATMMCGKGIMVNTPQVMYTDTCKGDSGGPVMAKAKKLNCTYIVVAVVSFGPTCGKGVPATYTKVAPYIDWIVDTVWPDDVHKRWH